MTKWQERLSAIVARQIARPKVVEILRTPDLDGWEPGKVQTSWNIDPDFFSLGGQLFGGYVGALADQVASHAAFTVIDDATSVRTASLGVYFHAPMRQGRLSIIGRVVAESRSRIHVRVEFSIDDQAEICAHAEAVLAKVPLPST
jgi:acyl-coenzyme A thioesterase PaaI-like protein